MSYEIYTLLICIIIGCLLWLCFTSWRWAIFGFFYRMRHRDVWLLNPWDKVIIGIAIATAIALSGLGIWMLIRN